MTAPDLTATMAATQVYRVYIRATAEAIWTAITDPDWTVRYGYGGYRHYGSGGHTAAEGAVTCKAAAKMDFPNDRKARRASKKECKAASKASHG